MIKRPTELTNASWKLHAGLTLPLVLAEQKLKDPKISDQLSKLKQLFEKIDWDKLTVEAAKEIPMPSTGKMKEYISRAETEAKNALACAEAAEALGEALEKLVPQLKKSKVLGSGLLRKHVEKMVNVNAEFVKDLKTVPKLILAELEKINDKHDKISVERIVADDSMCDDFLAFCQKERNSESLEFYLLTADGGSQEIIDGFLMDGSDQELNVPKKMRDDAVQAGANGQWKGGPWDALRMQVLVNMYDPFARFRSR